MENENSQTLRVVFVISHWNSKYMQYFAKTCRFKWIDCGEIKTKYNGYVYFEPLYLNVIYQTLN